VIDYDGNLKWISPNERQLKSSPDQSIEFWYLEPVRTQGAREKSYGTAPGHFLHVSVLCWLEKIKYFAEHFLGIDILHFTRTLWTEKSPSLLQEKESQLSSKSWSINRLHWFTEQKKAYVIFKKSHHQFNEWVKENSHNEIVKTAPQKLLFM